MSPLEARLTALGPELELPVEPDLAPAVLARLEGRRPFPWRRAAAIAFAVLALAVGAAFAVPQARTAILRFFHLGGATVVRVETLPPAVERAQAHGLGQPLSRADAEQRLGFRLALPPSKSPLRRVYVLDEAVGSVFVGFEGRRVLLSEFRSFGPGSLKKLVAGRTTVEPTQVGGHEALWIEGAPHTLTYFGGNGLEEQTILVRGNVLLWLRGGLTLRVEGKLTRAQAIALAQRVR